MKTATLQDLKTSLATIVAWVERGEDVMVRGIPKQQPVTTQTAVDWSMSAVFRRPPGNEKIAMTADELQTFYQDMRGSH